MKKKTMVKLISRLLEMASDEFENHGCNDLDDDFWEGVSTDEKINLYKKYHEWNGDPEEFDQNTLDYIGDSSLMAYFSENVLKLGE